MCCNYSDCRDPKPGTLGIITQTFSLQESPIYFANRIEEAWKIASLIHGQLPSPWTHPYLSICSIKNEQATENRAAGQKAEELTHIRLSGFLPLNAQYHTVGTSFHSLARELAHIHWSLVKRYNSVWLCLKLFILFQELFLQYSKPQ